MADVMNQDAPAIARRRRRIARQQREMTPEPIAKTGGTRPKYSDEESSSTTDFNTISLATERLIRCKPKTASVACGSNTGYRNKILNRRDKACGTSSVTRSQSTPRPANNNQTNDASSVEDRGNSSSGSNVMSFLRQAKRSLSIPRRKKDHLMETDPYAYSNNDRQSPNRQTEHQAISPAVIKNQEERELTKLELNLRRFEEERRKFEYEKEKFEREKKKMEKNRFNRLLEFERKRTMQRLERERLVAEAAASIQASQREFERRNTLNFRSHSKSKSRERDEQLELQRRNFKVLDNNRDRSYSFGFDDDYESSTVDTTSSRDGDFDIDDEYEIHSIEDTEVRPPSILKHWKPSGEALSPDISSIDLNKEIVKNEPLKESFLLRLLFGKKKKEKAPIPTKPGIDIHDIHKVAVDDTPISIKRILFMEMPVIWRQLLEDYPNEWEEIKLVRNRCISDSVILTIYFGAGGLVFRFIEGAFENFYKCGVRRVKRDFIDHLWQSSHNLREDDWKSMARNRLRLFEEELHVAHEAGLTTYSGQKSWTFLNSVNYCMSIATTIGYGHISPVTRTGRAVTIIYAIFGIPMFLILLADFGKLFTRGIKFLWAYVRRLYYTGSLRKVRKQAHVQGVLRGMNMAYEIATFRRPSMMVKDPEADRNAAGTPQSNSTHLAPPSSETPTTPLPADIDIDIDDEFNLPISVALTILLAYIFIGASVYTIWEDWTFFESCYFVFISMSTIGFGDFVPKNPIFMMLTIFYLIFGLSLTSMCINVVQVKLSDSFRQASAKIGATIGLKLAEEEAKSSQNLTPVPENASLHSNSYSVRPEPIFNKSGLRDNESFKFNGDNESGSYDNADVKGGRIIFTDLNKQMHGATSPSILTKRNDGNITPTDKQNNKKGDKKSKK